MSRAPLPAAPAAAPERPGGNILGRLLLHCLSLLLAAVAFVAYQHFKLQGQSTQSFVSLIGAGVLALAPVRALIGAIFGIEGKLLHAMHGIGGLAFVGLAAGGVISGAPVLSHAALAPFAIMGAAQAVMHQNHPRNARQAEALRRFATSLPEVEQLTKPGALTSPQNAARAATVLADLIGKAEVLGETELQADPGFQGALAQVTTRAGMTLGLDTIDQAITKLAANPAAAATIPDLRRRLARARSVVNRG